VEGRAVPSPQAEKGGCVGPGILVADGTGFAEHVAGGLVGRGGFVIEVNISVRWLLEEPGDMLYIDREAKRRRKMGENSNVYGPNELKKLRVLFKEAGKIWL
jgi:hypothetical protein